MLCLQVCHSIPCSSTGRHPPCGSGPHRTARHNPRHHTARTRFGGLRPSPRPQLWRRTDASCAQAGSSPSRACRTAWCPLAPNSTSPHRSWPVRRCALQAGGCQGSAAAPCWGSFHDRLRRLVVVQGHGHMGVHHGPALLRGEQLLGHGGQHGAGSHRVQGDARAGPVLTDRGATDPPGECPLGRGVHHIAGLGALGDELLGDLQGPCLVPAQGRLDHLRGVRLERGHGGDDGGPRVG